MCAPADRYTLVMQPVKEPPAHALRQTLAPVALHPGDHLRQGHHDRKKRRFRLDRPEDLALEALLQLLPRLVDEELQALSDRRDGQPDLLGDLGLGQALAPIRAKE